MNCSSLARRALGAGLFALFFLCLGASGARAEVAAHTDFVHGLVTATAAGQSERTLLKGAEVFDRDSINTADGARAQLRFSDGGLVSLLPNTTFSVEEYRLGDAGGEDGSLVFGLLRGGLRTVTGAIGKSKPDNYQLKTPVGTLGIRGTEFIAVIDPPGTLRVHVGRGKVVLTNQYGTLEVPEGYNAIMTLDEAPRLTEEGPVYMASGPNGDLRVPAGMVRSDPYRLDLPLFGALMASNITTSAPNTAGGGTGPGTGGTTPPPINPFLQTGSDYYMSVIRMDSPNGTPHSLAGMSGYAEFDAGDGALTSFQDNFPNLPLMIDLGGSGAAFSLDQSTVADLNWGTLSHGSIELASTSYSYSSSLSDPTARYLPYIIGKVDTTTPLSGTLNFSLPSGVTPPAYAHTGDIWTLTRFDLGLQLNATPTRTYTLDMNLTMPGSSYSMVNGTGTLNMYASPTFGFNNVTQITHNGTPCSSCALNATGFVNTSGNAGVTYSLQGGPEVITGVAPLVPTTGGGGAGLGI